MVTRLARLGFMVRRRSTTDNREFEVAFTTKGRKALRQLIPVARRYETRAAAGIAPAKLAATRHALGVIYHNLAPTED